MTTPSLDDWPSGAWKRVSITVRGAGPTEVADVWWLVHGRNFADIRVPRGGGAKDLPYSTMQAFAGTVEVDVVTGATAWHHQLDSEPRDPDVTGCLRPDPNDPRLMHERGPGFQELWARVDSQGSERSCAVTDRSISVQVGVLRATVRRSENGGVVGVLEAAPRSVDPVMWVAVALTC